jgi:hypothetical protein
MQPLRTQCNPYMWFIQGTLPQAPRASLYFNAFGVQQERRRPCDSPKMPGERRLFFISFCLQGLDLYFKIPELNFQGLAKCFKVQKRILELQSSRIKIFNVKNAGYVCSRQGTAVSVYVCPYNPCAILHRNPRCSSQKASMQPLRTRCNPYKTV